jgi:hypothetical protein
LAPGSSAVIARIVGASWLSKLSRTIDFTTPLFDGAREWKRTCPQLSFARTPSTPAEPGDVVAPDPVGELDAVLQHDVLRRSVVVAPRPLQRVDRLLDVGVAVRRDPAEHVDFREREADGHLDPLRARELALPVRAHAALEDDRVAARARVLGSRISNGTPRTSTMP